MVYNNTEFNQAKTSRHGDGIDKDEIMKRHGKKYRLVYLLLVIGLWLNGLAAQATVPVAEELLPKATVYFNDKKLSYSAESGEPFLEGGQIVVPLRQTMTAMGGKVAWEAVTRTVRIQFDGNTIEVPLEKYYFIRNGQTVNHDSAARLINGRTYIPIRAIIEIIGAKSVWTYDSVQITYQKQDTSVKRIPKVFDLREYNRVTPVKDQQQSGACWAFASLGAMESALMPWEEYDFSEDNMSLGHGYNLSQAQGGDYMIALSYLTRWGGPVLEREDPFGDNIVNPHAKVVKHLQEAIFLPKEGGLGIKRAILLYGGVQSSLYFDQVQKWGDSEYYNEQTASYYYDGNRPINHDVVIVGWDDYYSRDNFKKKPKRDGAFLCKNSFGRTFGQEGYFYVSYEDKYIGQNVIAYTKIEAVNNYQHIYQSDKLGYLLRAGYGETSAYFANCYEPGGAEKLKAVSFYALEPNTGYEVYVITDFSGVSDFQRMESITKGSFSYAGYYTVKLGKGIPVDKKFAVVVRINSPGTKHPIATEAKGFAKWADSVDLTDGEGYISYDGKSWKRAEEYLEANVCLKAFTTNY